MKLRIVVVGIVVAGVAAALGVSALTREAEPVHREVEPIKVGVLPIPDAAPLYIAINKGYFTAEGLPPVHAVTVTGGGPAMNQLKSGALQASLINYPSAILQHQKDPGRIVFIADAYRGAPGGFKLVASPDGPIKTLADLKPVDGKKKIIAVLTLSSIGTITARMALDTVGIAPNDVSFVEVRLDQMGNALKTGRVQAAWMTEPVVTQWREEGGRELYDVMTGKAHGLAIAGWGVSTEYAEDHPDTVKRLQRALVRAQRDAASDRQLVTATMDGYTDTRSELLPRIALGVFPEGLDLAEIRRVETLMRAHGEITATVEVASMVWSGPPASPSAIPSPPATSPQAPPRPPVLPRKPEAEL